MGQTWRDPIQWVHSFGGTPKPPRCWGPEWRHGDADPTIASSPVRNRQLTLPPKNETLKDYLPMIISYHSLIDVSMCQTADVR